MSIAEDSLIGTVLAGQFRIERLMGSGGMGAVYLAEQLGVGRQVVVKLMHPHLGSSAQLTEFEERFQREARLVAQLNHPNLVDLYTVGRSERGQLYLAMEYVPGRTLRQVLLEEGALSEGRVLDLLDQMCAALHEAHEFGIVHRDLKPDNVMLTRRRDGSDLIKVLDFGIAKPTQEVDKGLTVTGAVFGTPQYMAPEQARALPVDQRTDIYALGLITYELLTGAATFEADSAMDLLLQHVGSSVVPPSERRQGLTLGPDTERLIARCLEKDPARRFADALELQAEVRRAQQRLGAASEFGAPAPGMRQGQASGSSHATLSSTARPVQQVPTPQHQAPRTGAFGDQTSPAPASSQAPRMPLVVLLMVVLLGCLLPVGGVTWYAYGRFQAASARVEGAAVEPIESEAAGGHAPPPVPTPGEQVPQRDAVTPPPSQGSNPSAEQLEALQRKHEAYVSRCFDWVSESGYRSRARYRSWVNDDKGPTKSRHVYGLYETSDPGNCRDAIAEHASTKVPALDAAMQEYITAAEALYELTGKANIYYEQRDYEEDDMARGRELHLPLLAGFDDFARAGEKLAVALDLVMQQLVRAHRASASPEERARLEADLTALEIARLGNVDWRKMEDVDLPAFRALVERFEQQLNAVGKPSSNALSFLGAAKEFGRRVQQPNWSTGERMHIKDSGSAWMVKGSPSDLLRHYNALEPLFAPIARRQQTPVALSIDPY